MSVPGTHQRCPDSCKCVCVFVLHLFFSLWSLWSGPYASPNKAHIHTPKRGAFISCLFILVPQLPLQWASSVLGPTRTWHIYMFSHFRVIIVETHFELTFIVVHMAVIPNHDMCQGCTMWLDPSSNGSSQSADSLTRDKEEHGENKIVFIP